MQRRGDRPTAVADRPDHNHAAMARVTAVSFFPRGMYTLR
ncbi:hypothetical protein I551_0513 [Mycobacterium ulcerans str. Harvey]|uniref:Uncharacterized protein n=1 Tax=Mycobacterium ulcerans str. Harvey TaxID=1299332 RepID=A0ABP3ARV6_MYCUL|nr:hypothetical protein I551_0513 [Mycobacterium ulcerans str. Harvey]